MSAKFRNVNADVALIEFTHPIAEDRLGQEMQVGSAFDVVEGECFNHGKILLFPAIVHGMPIVSKAIYYTVRKSNSKNP